MIIDLPVDIVELDVYKGAYLVRFATFREHFENDSARRIIGFDVFGRFPRDLVMGDFELDFIDRSESESGDGLSILEITELLDVKRFQNVCLAAASILLKTLLKYLDDNLEMRVSLLHLDIDTYEPTKCAIDTLYD